MTRKSAKLIEDEGDGLCRCAWELVENTAPALTTHTVTDHFKAQPGMKWKPCNFSWSSGLYAHLILMVRLWQRQPSLFILSLSVILLLPDSSHVQLMSRWAEDMRWANMHHVASVAFSSKCVSVCVLALGFGLGLSTGSPCIYNKCPLLMSWCCCTLTVQRESELM